MQVFSRTETINPNKLLVSKVNETCLSNKNFKKIDTKLGLSLIKQ
jgi:hypothetical protein